MATTTAQKAAQTLYFSFDRRRLPLNPLATQSTILQMEDTPDSYLKHYGYELTEAKGDALRYYESKSADARYLVIVLEPGYRFLFHVRSDLDLMDWQERYERKVGKLHTLREIVPEPPADPFANHKIIHLDAKLVRQNGGVY